MARTVRREVRHWWRKEAPAVRRELARRNRRQTNLALQRGKYDEDYVALGPRKTEGWITH